VASAPLSDDLLRDIEEKAKAVAALPGNAGWWERDALAFVLSRHGARYQDQAGVDAGYLSLVSPSVVLSLLERLKKAEAERDLLRALVSEAHDVLPDHEVELRRRLVEAL
jgi:hypothetical protein